MSSIRFSGLNLKAYATNIPANTYFQREKNTPHYFVVELDTHKPDDRVLLDGQLLGHSEQLGKIAKDIRALKRTPRQHEIQNWTKQIKTILKDFKPSINRLEGRKFRRPLAQFFERYRDSFLKALNRTPERHVWHIRYEQGGDGPILPLHEALTPLQQMQFLRGYNKKLPDNIPNPTPTPRRPGTARP